MVKKGVVCEVRERVRVVSGVKKVGGRVEWTDAGVGW